MTHPQRPPNEWMLLEKVQTALLTLCTTVVIGCFAFLWDIHATITRHDVQIQENTKLLDQDDNQIDFLRSTVADHSVRLTKIETEQDRKTKN